MTDARLAAERRGQWAEALCALRLVLTGWRLVARRMKSKRGTGAGELDIVAKRGSVLAFIEVKTRASDSAALESVSPQQQARIVRGAEAFLQRNPTLANHDLRFDVMILSRGIWPRHIPDVLKVTAQPASQDPERLIERPWHRPPGLLFLDPISWNHHVAASETKSESARTALGRIAAQADEAIDIADAALVMAAADHPATDLEVYRAHFTAIAEAVHEAAIAADVTDDNPDPESMAAILSAVLSGQFRYRGDEETYDDLDNANLMRVIERRKGLPVALGILYLMAARTQGWSAMGLNFPGHFLIRLESRDGRRIIIDPFHGGRVMEAPSLRELLKVVSGPSVELEATHYKPVSNRDILIRLQNNVKTRRLELNQVEGALEALSCMQILAPGNVALWREAGVMQMRLGQLKRAVESLETYVARAPEGPDRNKISQVVNELRDRLH